MHPPTSRDRLSAAGSALGGVGPAIRPPVILSIAALLLAATVGMGPWLFAAPARAAAAQSSGTQAQQTPSAQSAPKGQQPPLASGKIESKVKVVTVYATVRDKKSKIVSDLTKDDFALAQDGAAQTVTYFARDTDVPLTIGPLVDTSYSTRHVLGAERDASYSFLNDLLRPDKDKAFLIHFDREVELLQDLTSSRDKLKAAIAMLDTPGRDDEDQGGGQPHFHAGTLLYDAIFLASDEILKKQQGRKALIVLSDGVDRGSKKDLEDAVESAQRADTAVYSILFGSEEEHEHGGGFGHGGGGPGGHGPYGYPGGGYPGGGGGGGGYPGGGGQRRNPQHEQGDNG